MPNLLKPLLPLVFVAGCASPSLEFTGKLEAQKNVGRQVLHLYRSGDRVQVIRTGYASRSEQKTMPDLMASFVREYTECDIARTDKKSDAVVLIVELRC